MPVSAYMSIEGRMQGPILGPLTDAGREGWFEVHAYSHALAVEDGSEAIGHTPVTVLKSLDQTTPKLMWAWASHEDLEVRLHFFHPVAGTGAEEEAFTVTLTNAIIAEFRHEQLNNIYPENVRLDPREQISFAYTHIEWTWNADLTSYDADWGG